MKPILFNTEMVCGIQDGRKTVTRRVVKGADTRWSLDGLEEVECPGLWAMFESEGVPGFLMVKAPYQLGDILYVRETWAARSRTEGIVPELYYKANRDAPDGIKWRPSIHMPREAARIFLKVTDVRVERLRDIAEESAQSEGFYRGWQLTEKSTPASTAKQAFMWMWDTIIKYEDIVHYGWLANPWVLVIEFERISKKEAMQHDG